MTKKLRSSFSGWHIQRPPLIEISEEMLLRQLRRQIKYRMRELGYPTLESLAADCKINKGNLSRFLNGKHQPLISTLWKICQALGWKDLPQIWEEPRQLPEDWESL